MSSRRDRKLSDEERVLWNVIARTTAPLKGRRAVEIPEIPAAQQEKPAAAPAPAVQAQVAAAPTLPKRQYVAHTLDVPTRDKLSKGRLPIEGRVDLHGMTQDEAYSLLYAFLSRAHAGGLRYVLVITGKGNSKGGDGVLKRMVPAWLDTAPFRMLISSQDHAERHHGGSGALYIRIRRRLGA
ncbi:DNA-nicking Smr family endonuclease [Aminobacter aminovorans]|uniref:Probable DNA endonuclease SmrA n=1 Tax=Aminobacter aminovorans TaxID=83263 RepID=A0A380WES3_AMIAI|nr:Smr/MutS family protein [Aminobacter aminovorans]TCS23865.1 DNA-nicking Smr family endonuclease [Aminobacter aminovorans]SUU87523.1 Probable DNA endonuclease SmrA [Aminobacter aminovorans]